MRLLFQCYKCKQWPKPLVLSVCFRQSRRYEWLRLFGMGIAANPSTYFAALSMILSWPRRGVPLCEASRGNRAIFFLQCCLDHGAHGISFLDAPLGYDPKSKRCFRRDQKPGNVDIGDLGGFRCTVTPGSAQKQWETSCSCRIVRRIPSVFARLACELFNPTKRADLLECGRTLRERYCKLTGCP